MTKEKRASEVGFFLFLYILLNLFFELSEIIDENEVVVTFIAITFYLYYNNIKHKVVLIFKPQIQGEKWSETIKTMIIKIKLAY